MAALIESRIDPAQFSNEEREELERANDLVRELPKNQRAKLHFGSKRVEISIPAPVYHQLVRVLGALSEGKALVILPEDESLTTQAAAEFLGTSRFYLVSLLSSNQIKHHMVGSHRRIYLRDLLPVSASSLLAPSPTP